MRIAVIPPHKDLLNNRVFGTSQDYDLRKNQGVNRIGYNKLQQICESNGHNIDTIDKVHLGDIDVCLFIDTHHKYLKKLKMRDDTPVLVYLMREPPTFVPENNIGKFLRFSELFNASLTWNDEICKIDSSFYKYRYPQRTTMRAEESDKFEEKKLLTSVSSRKHSNHPNELYSAREDIIRYFTKYHQSEFKFYGRGWNEKFDLSERYHFGKPDAVNYHTYGGEISDKLSVYFKNKFALCFENTAGVDGYITEKIFDCYRAGIVPVYWGASNITDEIPEDSFVDYRNFRNPKSLYEYLQSIDEEEHKRMVKKGKEYFINTGSKKYSPTKFAQNVYRCLTEASQFDQAEFEEVPSYDNELRCWIESLGATKRGRHIGIKPEKVTRLEKITNITKIAKRNPKTLFNQPDAIAAALRF